MTGKAMPKASKGERPFALENADVERLLNMIVALTAEVSVLQDQLDTFGRLAAERGIVSQDDLAHYQPDAQAAQERAGRRQALIERVLRIIIADTERAMRDEQPYAELLSMVTGEHRTPGPAETSRAPTEV